MFNDEPSKLIEKVMLSGLLNELFVVDPLIGRIGKNKVKGILDFLDSLG